MNDRDRKRRGRAKITLGISLLFAVGIFAYLALSGNLYRATGIAVLILVAGGWEYRRTMQDIVTAERYEAEANRRQEKRRR